MSNLQILFQIIGWGYLFYLSNRTLKKAESSKQKESLLSNIKETQAWLIKSCKKNCDFNIIETTLASKIAQLEFKVRNLNDYTGVELYSTKGLSKFLLPDLKTELDRGNLEKLYFDLTNDMIENIEINFKELYFNPTFVTKIKNKPLISLVQIVASTLVLLFLIIEILKSILIYIKPLLEY